MRNLQKTDFEFCSPKKFFGSDGTRDMKKLTSEMESTHVIGPENRNLGGLELVPRRKSGRNHFSVKNRKTRVTVRFCQNSFECAMALVWWHISR